MKNLNHKKLNENLANDESKDESIDRLTSQLSKEKNDRDEDRFIFIVISIIFINFYIFSNVENWAGAIIIGVLELTILIILARRYGIGEVWAIIQQILNWNKADESKNDDLQ